VLAPVFTDRGSRRPRDEIGFDENYTGIMRQRVHAIFDGSVVEHSQPEDGSGAELIERSRIESVAGSNRRQITGAGELNNDFTGDKVFAAFSCRRDSLLLQVCQQVDREK
jgi:hypothetical protein